jgi:hypothetical protein
LGEGGGGIGKIVGEYVGWISEERYRLELSQSVKAVVVSCSS